MMRDLPIVGEEYWYTQAKLRKDGRIWCDLVKPIKQEVIDINTSGGITLSRYSYLRYDGRRISITTNKEEGAIFDSYYSDYLFETEDEAIEAFNKQLDEAVNYSRELSAAKVKKILKSRII